MEETSQIGHKEIIGMYEKAISARGPDDQRPEEAYVHLAKYLNRLFDLATVPLEQVLENYLLALENGAGHVYHTMPKFLTLWLAHGDGILDRDKDKTKDKTKEKGKTGVPTPVDFTSVNRIVDKAIQKLPAFEVSIFFIFCLFVFLLGFLLGVRQASLLMLLSLPTL